jgi:O-antigen/teichoic acid export membrane protein
MSEAPTRSVGPGRLRRLGRFLHRTDGSLQHRALRSGVWVGASSVATAGLTFARGVVLARLVSPESFGLMAVCLMATRVLDIFTETGFGAALIHRQEKFEEARDTAFTMRVLRGIGLAVLAAGVAPWAAAFYGRDELTTLVTIVGLSFVFTGFQNINVVALQKELDFRRLTYMETLSGALSFVAAVALALWLRNVWALVLSQIAAAMITSALSFVMVPGRVRFRLDMSMARELYRYGRFMTGLAVVVFLTRELDNALIGKILGMQALGFYVAAYSLANLPSTYISRVVSRVMFPLFSKLQNERSTLRTEYLRGVRMITMLVVPVSIVMIVLAPEVVAALYGDRWAEAAAPLRMLAVFGCFRSLWMLNGYLYNAIGRPQIDFYVNLGRLVAMGALLYPLTMRYGLVGAGAAVSIPMVLQFAVGVVLSRRFIQVPLSGTLSPLFAAVAQGIVLAALLSAARAGLPAGSAVMLLALGGVAAAASLVLNISAAKQIFARLST